jgi:hypothetical protein
MVTGGLPLGGIAAIPTATLLGSNSGSTAVPAAITGAQAEALLQFTASGTGAVQQTLDAKVKQSINVKDFAASGSNSTTTGTISSSSTALTLTSSLDFVNGQGILIYGAGATFAAGNVTGVGVANVGATGSTTHAYQLSCLDQNGGVGIATTAVSTTTSNATLSYTNFNNITFSLGSGCTGAAIYRDNVLVGVTNNTNFYDTGGLFINLSSGSIAYTSNQIPATPTAAAINDYLVTSVVSGGGTTSVTLNNAATNTVSGVAVIHDDTAAIQAAINALPAAGGTVNFPAGFFNISSTINIGNGSSWLTHSTKNGVVLSGAGPAGNFWTSNWALSSATILSWQGGAAWSAMVQVNGTISGWGLDNLSLYGNDYVALGLQTTDAFFGHDDNFSTVGCGMGKASTTYGTTAGEGAADNSGRNVTIMGKGNGQYYGMKLQGANNGTDNYNETYINLHIFSATTGSYGTGLILQSSDNDMFYRTMITTPPNALQFDYTNANYWPASNMFFGLDTTGGVIGNSGAPGGGATPNFIYGMARTNGAVCPNVANLICEGDTNGAANINGFPIVTGHSTAPSAATCTGFSLGTGATDLAGKLTYTSATTCSVTFGTAFTNAPSCTVTPGSAASTTLVTTTTGGFAATFGTAQTALSWHCIGN